MQKFRSITSIVKILVVAFILLAYTKYGALNFSDNREDPTNGIAIKYTYLALGDSYTVGESVRYNQSFPVQLAEQIRKDLSAKVIVDVIATTGWRTDNLLDALKSKPKKTYDMVTLLIGVNNQYQGSPFAQYEDEFPKLLDLALVYAGNNPKKVVVISIPDYGYTPFGQYREMEKISKEIDDYNYFAMKTADSEGVRFANITDVTRRGLENPNLVAKDGLHPSGDAYREFVTIIAPFIYAGLKD